MKRIKITRLNGTYYRLCDDYGEIEFSDDYDYIVNLFYDYKNDEDIKEELYNGGVINLRLTKEIYKDGRLIEEEIL